MAPALETAGPSISVTIPTKNSERWLERCLLSVAEQQVSAEVIIADDCSVDETRTIAARFGARVLLGPLPLLEARVRAAEAASADAIVLLDSDQVLRPGVFARCLELLSEFDVLVLGESSYNPSNWLSKLFAADRRLLHHLQDHHLNAERGSLLPRVFNADVLKNGLCEIPTAVQRVAVAQDHAILWSAVAKLRPSVGVVPDAVMHEEMASLAELWRKYFHWGTGLPSLFGTAPEYRQLTQRAVHGRLYRGGAPMGDYLQSIALLAIKSVPYGMGFAYGKVTRRRRLRTARAKESPDGTP
jgi:glycosyltransferase involved in cell wall biosynthesis